MPLHLAGARGVSPAHQPVGIHVFDRQGDLDGLRHHAYVEAGNRWYLEMTARDQLRPTRRAESRLELRECSDPVLFRGIHRRVATPHGWSSLHWSEDRWAEEFARPNLRWWTGHIRDEVVGMASADMPPDANFEITSFGLVAEHVGKGIGGLFLSVVVEVLWTAGAERIWLHTQDSDHEHALSNYLARGFIVYRTESLLPGPQPGESP